MQKSDFTDGKGADFWIAEFRLLDLCISSKDFIIVFVMDSQVDDILKLSF